MELKEEQSPRVELNQIINETKENEFWVILLIITFDFLISGTTGHTI